MDLQEMLENGATCWMQNITNPTFRIRSRPVDGSESDGHQLMGRRTPGVIKQQL